MLGAVELGIYLSMETTMSMMLLFTRSSRINGENVGSHANIFKSLRFGLFTLKGNSGSLQRKTGSAAFSKVVFDLENARVV